MQLLLCDDLHLSVVYDGFLVIVTTSNNATLVIAMIAHKIL
jgi:hypothetical protein